MCGIQEGGKEKGTGKKTSKNERICLVRERRRRRGCAVHLMQG